MSRCEEEFDGHRRGGREKEEKEGRRGGGRRKKRGRKKGLKKEAKKGKKEEEEEERTHFPISLSKSSSVFAQCVNESSVKPFSCHCSVNLTFMLAALTRFNKRSLCIVSFPNR